MEEIRCPAHANTLRPTSEISPENHLRCVCSAVCGRVRVFEIVHFIVFGVSLILFSFCSRFFPSRFLAIPVKFRVCQAAREGYPCIACKQGRLRTNCQ